MTAHGVIAITAFICGVACAIASSFVVSQMVDKVNDKLPEERQFSHTWWYWSKYQRLFADYKKVYPNGPLLRTLRIMGVLVFVCFLATVWGLGFFSR
jgi:hypothetical protein